MEAKQRRFAGSFLGLTVRVLVESARGSDQAQGWSDHYLRVRATGTGAIPGRFVLVRVNGFDKDGLCGVIDAAIP
jgi:tRNA A37 methylthiotransferase MiaB